MEAIRKQYIVDENNRKVAVQIDYDTFRKIEDALENHLLVHLMEENRDDETLNSEQAKSYYQSLEKAE